MSLVSVSLAMNCTYAQSLDNFQPYSNNDMKFTIEHPTDWAVDGDAGSQDMVRFMSSDRPGPIFVISTQDVQSYLDTDTMTLKNTTLQQEARQTIEVLSSVPDINFKLVRQNEVNFGSNVGYKIEYTAGIFYTFQIYTQANGKIYSLLYNEYPLKVPQTLPLANKMVESFVILK